MQVASQSIDSALIDALTVPVAQASRVGVALSGGMDSVVLLHALCRLRDAGRLALELSAIHVHHGLSAHAESWGAFCTSLCGALGVPLQLERVSVPRDSGEGLEGAARRLRHAVFAACPVDWLLLAHHRDDQAETLLLNLLRGAGVAGAAAMPAMRSLEAGPALLRPLLETPRASIEAYAAEYGLRWVNDESNGDRHFRRNFLRHDVLPQLEAQFPGARQSLARAAGHFGEAAQLLDDLAQQDAIAVRQPSGRLGLAAFNRLTPAHARNLLRHAWMAAGFRAPAARWIEEARKQLLTTESASETCVETPEGALHVYRGELHFVPQRPPFLTGPVPWRGEDSLPWDGGTVRFERRLGVGVSPAWLAADGVELRLRQGGERFRTQANRPRRSLRHVLQAAAIPPWERLRLPLCWAGGRLVWIGGLGVDADCACRPDELGWLPVWQA